jgi:phosphonoacetaldehyde hydrolase
MAMSPTRIRLAVLDWAGTTVDFGSFAPVAPFVAALARHGVEVSPAQARFPMGLNKLDHLRALLRLPEVAARWHQRHGRDWTEADVERLYTGDFVPLQLEALARHSRLVPGLLDTVTALRQRGVKVGTSTGYFRAAGEVVFAAAARQGYVPDHNVLPDEVPAGRPAPWMIFRNMEALGVYPPTAVVKVGDTPHDMAEARNAACWAVGVLASSSAVGCSEDEWHLLPAGERQARCAAAAEAMREAGAHLTIDTVADLPAAVEEVERRVARGEQP